MKQLIHTESFEQYRYECPRCETVFWFGPNQLSNKRFFMVCDCGFSFKPTPPKGLEIQDTTPQFTGASAEAIHNLISYGYSKEEARQLIQKISNKDNKSVEQIIIEAISLE